MTTAYLAEFSELDQECRRSPYRFEGFRRHSSVTSLQWPDDVLEALATTSSRDLRRNSRRTQPLPLPIAGATDADMTLCRR